MEKNIGFVPSKGSQLKGDAVNTFENVVFSSRRKRVVKNQSTAENDIEEVEPKKKTLDVRKLRYEIIKFGTAGLSPSDKEASSVALAVSLGAKPPKRQYNNYKEILESKKMERGTKRKTPISEPTSRHLYVVGNKVIPAKPKTEQGAYKNFLDSYGKAGKPKFKRKKNRHR